MGDKVEVGLPGVVGVLARLIRPLLATLGLRLLPVLAPGPADELSREGRLDGAPGNDEVDFAKDEEVRERSDGRLAEVGVFKLALFPFVLPFCSLEASSCHWRCRMTDLVAH